MTTDEVKDLVRRSVARAMGQDAPDHITLSNGHLYLTNSETDDRWAIIIEKQHERKAV